MRKRLVILVVVMCGALGVSVASAAACTDSWTGGAGDGLWSSAGNWSTGIVPDTNADVCLPNLGHSYTVTLAPAGGSGGGTVNSLTIGTSTGSNTETLDIVGQSYVYNGETQNGEGLGVANGGTINATGSLVLDATAGGGRALSSDTLGGPAAFGDSPFGGGATIDNYGQIIAESSDYPTWDEQLNGDVDNEPGGSITVASGSLDQQTSNTVTNHGTVTTDASGDYDVTSGGTNDIFTNDGTVANNGTFEVQGQTGTFTQNGPVTGKAVTIESSATLADQSGAGTFTLEYGNPVLTGTIVAGQIVNVRGASYINGGETQNGTNLSLGGTAVTNDGTLTLDATGDGTKALQSDTVGGGVAVFDGTLTNNATLGISVDDPSWTNTLNAAVTNAHSGTITVAGGLNQNTDVGLTNDGTVTLAPSALYTLLQGGAFTNEADGTLASQIASTTSFGSFVLESPCCSGPGTITAGGTLTPELVSGFTPAAGTEFKLVSLQGGAFSGTFSTVGNGFAADYANESASPAFVGVIYNASSAPVVDATTTAVGCTPSSVEVGSAATCTATVTDSASSGASTPTGTVAFTSAPTTASFGTSGSCTLVATSTAGTASCAATFTPSGAGGYTITGSYSADSQHHTSSGTSSVTATTSKAGGGGTPTLGTLTIGAGVKVASDGLADVTLKCSGVKGATCAGTLKLTVRARIRVIRRVKGHRRTVIKLTTVQIGSAAYRLPAGQSETVGVKLSAVGVRLLNAARNRKLSAKASARASTGGTVTRTVTLTGPPRRRKTKK